MESEVKAGLSPCFMTSRTPFAMLRPTRRKSSSCRMRCCNFTCRAPCFALVRTGPTRGACQANVGALKMGWHHMQR